VSNKQAKTERSAAKDQRQAPANDVPSNGKKRKSTAKDWIVLERGSDEYILQCNQAMSFMSWLTDWLKRGEYDSKEKAEAAVRHFQSQTGTKYIHKVIHKDERDRP